MEFSQLAREFYTTEVFENLRLSYNQRLEQISKAFTMAIERIEESEVLQQMKGDDLSQYRVQHIAEISKQVLHNEQQLNLEEYLRTISQLKAQLAVQKMEMSLNNRRTPDKDREKDIKRIKELEEDIKYLKKQLQVREAQDINLEAIIDRQIKGKMKIMEQEYILKEEHKRVLIEKEKEFGVKLKMKMELNNKEERELQTKKMVEKYEGIVEGERRKYEQGLRAEKEKHEYLLRELTKENQGMKAKVDAAESKVMVFSQKLEEEKENSRQFRKQLEAKEEKQREQKYLEERFKEEKLREQIERERQVERDREREREMELQKEREERYLQERFREQRSREQKKKEQISPRLNIQQNISKQLMERSRNFKEFTLMEDIQQLQHFKSRIKNQNMYTHEDIPLPSKQSSINPVRYSKGFTQHEPPSYEFQRLQSKRSYQSFDKVPEYNNYVLPRSPQHNAPRGNVSPRWQEQNQGKFDEIQNSFAKQLAELRSKMTQKKVVSPDNRRNLYMREESVKKRLQQTTGQYSSKYSIKNYHHH